MAYDLNGKKYILSVNIVKYTGINRDRIGTEKDERAIIDTFKVGKYRGGPNIVANILIIGIKYACNHDK